MFYFSDCHSIVTRISNDVSTRIALASYCWWNTFDFACYFKTFRYNSIQSLKTSLMLHFQCLHHLVGGLHLTLLATLDLDLNICNNSLSFIVIIFHTKRPFIYTLRSNLSCCSGSLTNSCQRVTVAVFLSTYIDLLYYILIYILII